MYNQYVYLTPNKSTTLSIYTQEGCTGFGKIIFAVVSIQNLSIKQKINNVYIMVHNIIYNQYVFLSPNHSTARLMNTLEGSTWF